MTQEKHGCGAIIPPHVKDCVGCGDPVGYPNIRAAERDIERAALDARLSVATVSASAGGYSDELQRFGEAVGRSHAVMGRGLNGLDAFVHSDNVALVSYYKMVRSGGRIPEDSKWDRQREIWDAAANPVYYEELQYCALSLDGRGVKGYGDYFVTFKDTMIAKRASVFEENPFVFFDRQRISPNKPAPLGYRAAWNDRGELAKAKLFPYLRAGMKDDEFPGVLIRDHETDPEQWDFIEVHVYGVLHRSAIERVIAPARKVGTDRHVWRKVRRTLDELGVEVLEI